MSIGSGRLDSFDKRMGFGGSVQEEFSRLWEREFSRIGRLVLTDNVAFVSNPDYLCPAIGMYFEVKRKRLSWEMIEKDDGMIWINKKSMDAKIAKDCIVVVFFEDKGWKVIDANLVRKLGVVDKPKERFDGSGDEFYKVRQILFEKLETVLAHF